MGDVSYGVGGGCVSDGGEAGAGAGVGIGADAEADVDEDADIDVETGVRQNEGCDAGEGLFEAPLVLTGDRCDSGLGGICDDCEGRKLPGRWRSWGESRGVADEGAEG